ncbi:MAG: DUF3343 domain-containing protein [Clostridia bacterium]|nr:DUF3343 domain-containing protein [Clostridia bacterium]
MRDIYGVAAFRSRQQVLRFEAALKRQGIPARVVTTPRDIAMGCGLSVRFPMEYLQDVRRALLTANVGNLIGLYRAEYDGTRLRVRPA